jgi:aspartate racemase
LVDLVDCVGARLRAQRCKRVAVLATSFALADRSLLGRLAEAGDVSLILPAADRYPVLDQIIFNELADQRISASSLGVLHEILATQAAQGADALLLATTDFAPIRKQFSTALPVLDAAEIHSEALVDAALS